MICLTVAKFVSIEVKQQWQSVLSFVFERKMFLYAGHGVRAASFSHFQLQWSDILRECWVFKGTMLVANSILRTCRSLILGRGLLWKCRLIHAGWEVVGQKNLRCMQAVQDCSAKRSHAADQFVVTREWVSHQKWFVYPCSHRLPSNALFLFPLQVFFTPCWKSETSASIGSSPTFMP